MNSTSNRRSRRGRLLAGAGITALAAAAAVAPATIANAAPSAWSASGDGTTTVIDDGHGDSTASFSYNDDGDLKQWYGGVGWTFQTTAPAAMTENVHWSWSGCHAWFESTGSLSKFVTHNGVTTTTLLGRPGGCGFTWPGDTSFTLAPGDTYGFRLTGSNYDGTKVMRGQFTLSLGASALGQTVNETVNPGLLGFASNPDPVTPPSVLLNGLDEVSKPFSMPLDVADASGSGAGWQVTLAATPFTDNTGHQLGALTQTSAGSPGCDAGATCTLATDVGGAVQTLTAITGPAVAAGTTTVIEKADATTGMGSQHMTPSFQLAVPANSYAGQYASTWTVTVATAP